MTFAWAVLGYLVFMGLVLTIHEFGHFAAARVFGIKVSRFSIGMGRIVWRKASPTAGEWALSSLPIGGYVKFARRGDDGLASKGDRFFDESPASARLIVALAGPFANLATAVLALTLSMGLRNEAVEPVIGQPPADSILDRAGLKGGDRVLAINGRPIFDYTDLGFHNTVAALLIRPAHWTVIRDGRSLNLEVDAAPVSNVRSRTVGYVMGLVDQRRMAPPRVKGLTVENTSLQVGDRILTIDGLRTDSVVALQDAMDGRAGEHVELTVSRAGQVLGLEATLVQHPSRPAGSGSLGIEIDLPPAQKVPYQNVSVAMAIEATHRVVDYVAISFAAAYHLAAGHLGAEAFSGPAQIAHVSGQTAKKLVDNIEFAPALYYLALLSIGIGATNLLPIPVLDGGHAVIAICEMVARRRLPQRAAAFIQYAGLAALGMMLLIALMSDYLWLINL